MSDFDLLCRKAFAEGSTIEDKNELWGNTAIGRGSQ